jgi:APA family basic amino acid/polyamine antiporter
VVYAVAPIGCVVNLLLMLFLPADTWLRLLGWLAVGLVIYFAYGRRHSLLRRKATLASAPPRSQYQPCGGTEP